MSILTSFCSLWKRIVIIWYSSNTCFLLVDTVSFGELEATDRRLEVRVCTVHKLQRGRPRRNIMEIFCWCWVSNNSFLSIQNSDK